MKNLQEIDPDIVSLLGVRFHRLTKPQLLHRIIALSERGKSIIAYANIKTMNLAVEQHWYADFLNGAELVYCDGFGVVLGAKLAGVSITARHRSTCPDWLEELAGECVKHGRSLFLLSGCNQISDAAAEQLQRAFPDLRLAIYHGFFEKSGPENERVIAMINAFQADILCVGFGTPLQEQWIQQNFDKIDAHVFLPIGACVDYYTGRRLRGPAWLTDSGFEWLCRLLAEPRRLWRRYLIGNPLFFLRVIRARVSSR
jgi:N-acetylglucosaminyldiphosphoundecaprenol N-acetyl-beta-D-mannosaminyltransferase